MKTLLLLLLLAQTPHAVIKTRTEVAENSTIVLDARASTGELTWKVTGPDVPFMTLDQDSRKSVFAIIPSAPSGVYRFVLVARTADAIDADVVLVNVVGSVPVPIPAPPQPPTPPQPPNPPDVTPVSSRVLIMFESSQKMLPYQYQILRSTLLRGYLTGRGEWRYWDKDTDASRESPEWQAIWNTAKADTLALPKLFIFYANNTYKAFPLPLSEQATLQILQAN